MKEIDLLKSYPKTIRDLSQASIERTDEVRLIARKFDKDFFDGERKYGYGGYNYNSRFWTNVVKDFADYYKLKDDVGSCIVKENKRLNKKDKKNKKTDNKFKVAPPIRSENGNYVVTFE